MYSHICTFTYVHNVQLSFSFWFLLKYSQLFTLTSLLLSLHLMVFSFLPKNVHFISKNAILCLFRKNGSPYKTVVYFILNNLHFPMVEGIAFYALFNGVFFSTKKCALYFKKFNFVFVS